jgi:hypothetical protein
MYISILCKFEVVYGMHHIYTVLHLCIELPCKVAIVLTMTTHASTTERRTICSGVFLICDSTGFGSPVVNNARSNSEPTWFWSAISDDIILNRNVVILRQLIKEVPRLINGKRTWFEKLNGEMAVLLCQVLAAMLRIAYESPLSPGERSDNGKEFRLVKMAVSSSNSELAGEKLTYEMECDIHSKDNDQQTNIEDK